MTRGTKALEPAEFELLANETDALVLDVRNEKDFIDGHIPNSIFIGIDGGFAPWVGTLVKDVKQTILLVVPEGRIEEVVTRLSRVGFDNTLGFLNGGMEAWVKAGKEIDTIQSISAESFANEVKENRYKVFDVRKPSEFDAEHLEIASSTPLDYLNDHLPEFPKNENFYMHCAGGYRSVIAASILKSRGIHNLVDVSGGFAAIKKTDLKISNFVCSSKKN